MTSYQARLLLASSSRRKVWLAVLSINEASTTPHHLATRYQHWLTQQLTEEHTLVIDAAHFRRVTQGPPYTNKNRHHFAGVSGHRGSFTPVNPVW